MLALQWKWQGQGLGELRYAIALDVNTWNSSAKLERKQYEGKMEKGFLSRVSWNGTLMLMLIRVAFGTVGFFLVLTISDGFPQGTNIVALPLAVLAMSGISLIAAGLSQVGLPFAGLVSMIFSFPMYIGDPMVWVLHKVRPQWVPVDEPSFINPPFVWVLNE
ncbi:MAG: hypothetical protein HLUCCA12_17705 [Rhodobacteraceae bacterium HLUCCA12]|nr:MAG: hypothetical protein HLUCCA12_17705 [Rhodobacteraceae bacterium HLUCCA12]